MAPPKKTSGFMVFVSHWREETVEGRNMSIPQAVSHCGGMWEKMTDEQRVPFNAAANKQNGKGAANKERQNAAQAQREAAEKALQTKRSIEGIVMNAKKAHDLENTKFVFVAFNYFTKLHNSDNYVPAEFAACQYSLKDGIISMFSSLINPGQLNVGQNRDAREHATTTHLLPLPPKALGESNMKKLHGEIVDYLNQCQSTKPLVVFTTTEQIPMVKSCFRYLAAEAQEDPRNGALHRIVVFDIQYLFFVLKREVLDVAGLPNDNINVHITNAFFQRDFFEYINGIACDFHEANDKTKYCVQSMVMRWGYTFSDYMCGDLGINVVPGRHIPSNAKSINTESLSAATSRLSLRESSFDSFHSLQSFKNLRVSDADKPPRRRRDNSPVSSRRSSNSNVATENTDFASEDHSSRGGRRPKGATDVEVHSGRPLNDGLDCED